MTTLNTNANKEVEFLKTRIDAVTQDTQLLSDRMKEENFQTLETKVTEVEQENHDLRVLMSRTIPSQPTHSFDNPKLMKRILRHAHVSSFEELPKRLKQMNKNTQLCQAFEQVVSQIHAHLFPAEAQIDPFVHLVPEILRLKDGFQGSRVTGFLADLFRTQEEEEMIGSVDTCFRKSCELDNFLQSMRAALNDQMSSDYDLLSQIRANLLSKQKKRGKSRSRVHRGQSATRLQFQG